MSTEIVRAQPAAASLPEKMQYAQALAVSGMLPGQYRQQPANLLYALEYAESLGLHPMAAITGIHVIEGKPSASSALISALVRRAGHKLRVKGDDTLAVAQIIRADDPDFVYEVRWTMDRAKQAGLAGKKVWQQYPAAMLKARAITEVARDACEEALSGMHYTPEELGANVDAEGLPVDATVQQLRSVQSSESDQWTAPAPAQQTQKAAEVRDYLHEAHGAPDADTVRRIWQEAKADGAVPEYLHQIAEVGRAKATPDWMAGKPTPAFDGSATDDGAVVDGEVVGDQDDEHTAAERDLIAFAKAAGLPTIAADFEGAKGLPLSEATAPQIRAFLNELAA